MNDEYIYLDYAANTPVDKEVLDVFNDTTLKYYANLNSTHKLGRIVKKRRCCIRAINKWRFKYHNI